MNRCGQVIVDWSARRTSCPGSSIQFGAHFALIAGAGNTIIGCAVQRRGQRVHTNRGFCRAIVAIENGIGCGGQFANLWT